MAINRIHDFIRVDKQEISRLFLRFNRRLSVLDSSLIDNSMSNTGYVVTTDSGKYFLKLYSNTTDAVEAAAYSFLWGKINVPKILFYDGSTQFFPRPYAIMEYLEAENLKSYILSHGECNKTLIREIGRMCGTLHRRKYSRDAWLDPNLNETKALPTVQEHILQLLEDKAGAYLSPETRKGISALIETQPGLFLRINAESVLCHGDMIYSNTLIAGNKPYFIDFEFVHAGSPYQDIGKFFRTKAPEIQSLIDCSLYAAFADGYNAAASSPLPVDWLRLAHLCDIEALLCLINRDSAPAEWIADVEYDIQRALREGHPAP